MVKAFSLRVHSNAKITIEDLNDRLEIKLRNIITDVATTRIYLKLDSGIDAKEATKIDTIIYFMHHDIGLNVWDDNKYKINKDDIQ